MAQATTKNTTSATKGRVGDVTEGIRGVVRRLEQMASEDDDAMVSAAEKPCQ